MFTCVLCLPLWKEIFLSKTKPERGKALKRGSWWDLKCKKTPEWPRLDASWCRGWWSLKWTSEKKWFWPRGSPARGLGHEQEHESYPRFTFLHLSILELREQGLQSLGGTTGLLHKNADHLLWENPVTWVPESLDFGARGGGVLAEGQAASPGTIQVVVTRPTCASAWGKWPEGSCVHQTVRPLLSTRILPFWGPELLCLLMYHGAVVDKLPPPGGKWTANSVSIRLWGLTLPSASTL